MDLIQIYTFQDTKLRTLMNLVKQEDRDVEGVRLEVKRTHRLASSLFRPVFFYILFSILVFTCGGGDINPNNFLDNSAKSVSTKQGW